MMIEQGSVKRTARGSQREASSGTAETACQREAGKL